MKTLKLLVLAVSLIFAAVALAQDDEQMEMKIVVAGTTTDESTTIHWIGSGEAGFDMQAMQIGENQSFVDESGRAILVTREEEAFRFNIDGKTIVLPDFGDRPEYIALADGSDVTADFDIEIVGDHHAMSTMAMPAFSPGGVTIISGEPLDASTQESIKAVLLSVGRDDEVTFISHGDGSDGQVQMLRKRVEVIQ